MPNFRDNYLANRSAEKALLCTEGSYFPAFLWSAHAQSGFTEGIRRMQCDHKPQIRHERVDFVSSLEAACERFLEARFWIITEMPTALRNLEST